MTGEFVLKIECRNAAFSDEDPVAAAITLRKEVARLLEHAASLFEAGYEDDTLRDINGNRVGFFQFTEDEE